MNNVQRLVVWHNMFMVLLIIQEVHRAAMLYTCMYVTCNRVRT